MGGVAQQEGSHLVCLQGGLLLTPDLDELSVNKRKHTSRLKLLVRPILRFAGDRLRPDLERLTGFQIRTLFLPVLVRLPCPVDLTRLALAEERYEILAAGR